MPTYHAPFGGSNAKRWKNCIGYLRLAATLPRPPTNRAAIEGTAQHTCMELILREPDRKPADFLNVVVDTVQITPAHVAAMDEANKCVDDILSTFPDDAELYAERFLIFQGEGDEPKAGGSADLLIVSGTRGAVVDFKFGQIEVGADSDQNLFYMASAVRSFEPFFDVEKFEGYIIQPAFNPTVVHATYTFPEIDRAVIEFDTAIFRNEHHAPEYTPGDWCAFCPAAVACPAKTQALATLTTQAHDLNLEDAAQWFLKYESLEGAARQVRARLQHELEHGVAVPGVKLVARRTELQWTNPDEAFQVLVAGGFDQNDIVELIRPAEAIDMLPRDTFERLTRHPPGGNTVAPATDRRPAVMPLGALGAALNRLR